MIRRSEVEFFLRLHGLWEAIVALPPPPEPPFDVETMEPIEVPPHAIWRDDFETRPLRRRDRSRLSIPVTQAFPGLLPSVSACRMQRQQRARLPGWLRNSSRLATHAF